MGQKKTTWGYVAWKTTGWRAMAWWRIDRGKRSKRTEIKILTTSITREQISERSVSIKTSDSLLQTDLFEDPKMMETIDWVMSSLRWTTTWMAFWLSGPLFLTLSAQPSVEINNHLNFDYQDNSSWHLPIQYSVKIDSLSHSNSTSKTDFLFLFLHHVFFLFLFVSSRQVSSNASDIHPWIFSISFRSSSMHRSNKSRHKPIAVNK